MNCPRCLIRNNKKVVMTVEEAVTDYHDASCFWGHGQYEIKVLACPECSHVEEYEEENICETEKEEI